MDIARRYGESEPHSWFMIGVGMVALVANVICLILIRKHNNDEVVELAGYLKNDELKTGVVIAGHLL